MIRIETFGFLDWWNDQTIEMQQDWLTRHVDDRNRAVALANLKVRKPRVQIPAYTDRWMMGDRYGEVTRVTRNKTLDHEIAHVKLDKSGKTVRVILDDCTEV